MVGGRGLGHPYNPFCGTASASGIWERNENQPLIEALGDKDGTVEGRSIDVMVKVSCSEGGELVQR
jgi:hypothetical protein